MKVSFTEDGHLYNSGDYLSVTTLIGKFENPFDQQFWSLYKAYERVLGEAEFKRVKKICNGFKSVTFWNYLREQVPDNIVQHTRQLILDEWLQTNSDACELGSKYHKQREIISNILKKEINPTTKKLFDTFVKKEDKSLPDNYTITDNLYNLPDGYYPELLIYNEEAKLAGQADKVFIETIRGVRYVDIDDYKTNKKITIENKFASFLPPIQHIQESKFHLYELQLSLYALMMEMFGYTVRYTCFHHYRPNLNNIFELQQQYKTTYRKYEAQLLLQRAVHRDFPTPPLEPRPYVDPHLLKLPNT